MTQFGLFEQSSQQSSFLRMSPVCCQAIKDTTSRPSSVNWEKAGLVRKSLGEFWTVNTSEWHNDAVVSSLWQVLQSDTPSKFLLSPRACAGILRRANRRGKTLPPVLKEALQTVANGGTDEIKPLA